MLECIYTRTYGGKWWKFLCCHTWCKRNEITRFPLTIEKNQCCHCKKTEIMILIDWNAFDNVPFSLPNEGGTS